MVELRSLQGPRVTAILRPGCYAFQDRSGNGPVSTLKETLAFLAVDRMQSVVILSKSESKPYQISHGELRYKRDQELKISFGGRRLLNSWRFCVKISCRKCVAFSG